MCKFLKQEIHESRCRSFTKSCLVEITSLEYIFKAFRKMEDVNHIFTPNLEVQELKINYAGGFIFILPSYACLAEQLLSRDQCSMNVVLSKHFGTAVLKDIRAGPLCSCFLCIFKMFLIRMSLPHSLSALAVCRMRSDCMWVGD